MFYLANVDTDVEACLTCSSLLLIILVMSHLHWYSQTEVSVHSESVDFSVNSLNVHHLCQFLHVNFLQLQRLVAAENPCYEVQSAYITTHFRRAEVLFHPLETSICQVKWTLLLFPGKKRRGKREQDREREGRRVGNGRSRVMKRELVKGKGAHKENKAQSNTIPHVLFPRGNPGLRSLNKGEEGYSEMPGTLLRNE